MPAAIEGSLPLDELLSDHFVRGLHTRLYGDIWARAGRSRTTEVNIGVAPEQIAVELRNALDNIAYRGRVQTIGLPANWESPCMPRPCGSIRSRTEMDVPQGFSPIWCSPPPRTPQSGSTTGRVENSATSTCSAPSTSTETPASSPLSSEYNRSNPKCLCRDAGAHVCPMYRATLSPPPDSPSPEVTNQPTDTRLC